MEIEQFNLYRSNITFNPLSHTGMTPLKLGIYSFFAALFFTIPSLYFDSCNVTEYAYYLTYAENISWSISLATIFPAILGMTFYYYQKAPQLLNDLHKSLANEENPDAFRELCQKFYGMANHSVTKFLVAIISIAVNFIYFWSLVNNPYFTDSWMLIKSGKDLSFTDFTLMGIIGGLIQVFLTYWSLMFIVRNLFFIRTLYEFFRSKKFTIKLDPLHPDGVSGLGKLKQLASLQAVIILLFGLYVSLKVIDKVYQQHSSLLSDIGNPVVLLAYVILAPLCFFLILGSAHEKMRDARDEFLGTVTNRISELINQLSHVKFTNAEEKKEVIEELTFFQDQYKMYSQQISIWPFNWRSMQGFFGAVITPILPPIAAGISYIVKLF